MQKILLLGKNGMLGQAIVEKFKVQSSHPAGDYPKGEKFKIIALGRQDLDITKKSQVIKKISEIKPDLVINATGYTDVDGAESERQKAFAVNGDAVGYIAQACSQIGASFIHFSTDYVFDGSRAHGYEEDDLEHLGPLNVYGESKLIGEENVKIQISNVKSNPNLKCQKFFIIRTSWLYGAGGKNFVDAMLKRAIDGQTQFKVVNDQFGLPTYTRDLAERVLWMVDEIEQLESGIYHITNSKLKIQKSKLQLKIKNYNHREQEPDGISWFVFAQEIFKIAKELGILSKLPNVKPCTSDEFPRPARRPKYGALINTKLPDMREWKIALTEFLISNQF